MFKSGEVVHIDQGHIDDNYYDVIWKVEGLDIYFGHEEDHNIVDINMVRKLTDEEKGLD